MKKNRLFMLGLVTVFVAVLSLTLVSSTFARYTSTVTGGDSARVAKWEFKVDSNVIIGETPQTLTFDLFRENGIYELNNGNVAAEDDAEVANGTDGTPIIAPGTGGSYTFKIMNTSEVAANVKAIYSATNANEIPLEFSTTNETGSWKSLTDINAEIAKGKDLPYDDEAGYTITLYWRWLPGESNDPLDQTNKDDTALGIGGNATYNITITVVAVQKD